jgi:hypothetical protein
VTYGHQTTGHAAAERHRFLTAVVFNLAAKQSFGDRQPVFTDHPFADAIWHIWAECLCRIAALHENESNAWPVRNCF